MIRLAAIVFAFAMALSVPEPCAHAAVQTSDMAMTMDHTMADNGEHAMSGMMDHGADMADCPTGCDGGADCQGCTMMVNAVLPLQGSQVGVSGGDETASRPSLKDDAPVRRDAPPPRTGGI